jgi:hypothetical protein
MAAIMWCSYENGIGFRGGRDASFNCSTAEYGGSVGDRSDEWVWVIVGRVHGVASGRCSEFGGFDSGHHTLDRNLHKRYRLAAEQRGPYSVGNHSLAHVGFTAQPEDGHDAVASKTLRDTGLFCHF